ncbi:MAG: glycine cleavage system protein H, partial [Thermoplasmata archaeon]
VFVQPPEPGLEVEAAAAVGEVESTKSVSDIYSPLAGVIAETNADLADAPQRLNEDPYGEGWIFVLEPGDPGAWEGLLDPESYRELIAG